MLSSLVIQMGLIIKDVELIGEKSQIKLRALFDSGTMMTMVDISVAEKIGVKYTGKRVKVFALDGNEVLADEAIIQKIRILNEELNYERVLVFNFPQKLKKRLEGMGVGNIIIGILTIEAAGFILDPIKNELRKIGFFAL